MKRIFTYIFLFVFVGTFFAQNTTKGDSRTTTPNALIKIDGATQSIWFKNDNEGSSNVNTPSSGNENVSFNSTSEGIYINILNGTNKVKLFALTGQLLSSGDLNQGRWFIPTRKGIYFLKINNASYKVICK